jgi:riboflavin kinase/FMN adenylyltransferase
MLETGEMETVKNLLGYPYYVSGTVVHGHAIGRKLGIPTINLIPDDEKMLPPNGVYLTKTLFAQGERFGITNIGVKPTISGEEAKGIETHLFDFDGDLYDEELIVEFYAYNRGEKRFESLEALKEQLSKDVAWGKQQLVDTCQ